MTPSSRTHHAIGKRPPQFVAWDHHVPSFVPDVDALVRWAQARGRTEASAWVMDDVTQGCRQVDLMRVGDTWTLTDGHTYTVPADPSDDPVTLSVVDLFASHNWRLGRVARDDWFTVDPRDPVDMYAPYGFLPPEAGYPGGWTVYFCPELVASQMRWMEDQGTRQAYLASIDLRLALHLMHHTQEFAVRERIVEHHLIESGLFSLATEAQLRAMEGH